ncbi:hypothetical protein V6N13_036145 [Hibiscus sabdariffa]|uniref:Uncharacterized protein n=1 Tax=Hibiscus sabdariffa TaxID=183260 RepID=A0ABR2S780_9ROSI
MEQHGYCLMPRSFYRCQWSTAFRRPENVRPTVVTFRIQQPRLSESSRKHGIRSNIYWDDDDAQDKLGPIFFPIAFLLLPFIKTMGYDYESKASPPLSLDYSIISHAANLIQLNPFTNVGTISSLNN